MDKRLRSACEKVSETSTGLMWLLLPLPPVLELVAAVQPHSDRPVKVICHVMAALLVAVFAFHRVQRAHAIRFLEWLWNHREDVRVDGATYGEQRVETSTAFHQSTIVCAFLVYGMRVRTAYVVGERSLPYRIIATLVTLCLGWWSTEGFFWTLEAIVTNLVGSDRVTGGELLVLLEQQLGESQPVPATKPFETVG